MLRTSGGELRSLTGKLDLPVTIAFCSDLHDWRVESSGGPIWENNESLVVVINRRGRDEVWRVTVDGDAAPLSEGDTTITGIAAGGGRVVTTACDDAYPPEVFAVEPDGLRKLTRNGGAWLRRYAAPRITEVDAGGIPSFVLEPANARGPGAMVLSPHGGPYGAHGPTPELDGWALVELGYRVLLPNIRGSCGYGREWIKPNSGQVGRPRRRRPGHQPRLGDRRRYRRPQAGRRDGALLRWLGGQLAGRCRARTVLRDRVGERRGEHVERARDIQHRPRL